MTRAAGRLLSAIPSFLVAAGFAAAFARSATPRSLVDAIGALGAFWTITLIVASAGAGVLELVQDPVRPRVRLLRVGIVVHIVCAVTLAGYAVGVIFGPTMPLITIGLALAASTLHVVRWRRIVTQDIPVAELIAERRQ